MPVLFNVNSGNAEDVPNEAVSQALQSGTHELPLNDPEGNPASAGYEHAGELLQQGYTKPSVPQLKSLLEHAKYTSGGQQAITALESAGSAATAGLSTGLETFAGVDPESIRKRKENNPMTSVAGEVAGIAGSMLLGAGAPAVIDSIGMRTAAAAASAFEAGAANRIGSMATRAAVENAIFQSGNEVSKMFMNDPHQTVETAATEIGMSGLLGAGLGAGIGSTSELWKVTAGKGIDNILNALKNRSSGIPTELKTAANMNLTPEIEAALGDNPKAKQIAAELFESSTSAGKKYQAALDNFKTEAADSLGAVFGRNKAQLEDLGQLSKYETGKAFQKALVDGIYEKVGPTAEKFEAFEDTFKKAALTEVDRTDMANQISDLITEKGLASGPNESALKLANQALQKMPEQLSVQSLRNYISGLAQEAKRETPQYMAGRWLSDIFEEGLEKAVGREVGAAGNYADYVATKSEYAKFKNILREINDRLHIPGGKRMGAKGFTDALRRIDPEKVVNKLGLKDDVNLQNLLSEQFPQLSELAKQQEINHLLKSSLNNQGGIDANKLIRRVKELSPELKGHLVSEQSRQQLDAVQELLSRIPQRMNPSGTAKTADMLWAKVPASGMAMLSMMLGKNPILGYVLGKLGHYMGREAPDAVKLAMLKYMASSADVSASGLKAAASLARKTIQGEAKLEKSAKAVFGGQVADIKQPDADQLEKLKKQVDEISADPSKLLEAHDHTGHYMPEHGSAISLTAARNIQYLASLRPNTEALSPFSGKNVATAEQDGNYNDALKIAESPLLVMEAIKDGSLTQQQLQHLQAMYPGLYQRMGQKLTHHMLESSKDGLVEIPYKTQLALGVFLGGPVAPSMSPAAIMSAQGVPQAAQGQGRGPSSTGSGSRLQKLDKMPSSYATPSQQRQTDRASRR